MWGPQISPGRVFFNFFLIFFNHCSCGVKIRRVPGKVGWKELATYGRVGDLWKSWRLVEELAICGRVGERRRWEGGAYKTCAAKKML